jgi:hypothetical protein
MSQLSKVIAKTALSYTNPLEKLERTRVPIKREEHHTKYYIEQFDGIHGGMKALFRTEDTFRRACSAMSLNTNHAAHRVAVNNLFADCLTGRALDAWLVLVNGMPNSNFDTLIQRFYLKFCRSSARDDMKVYLMTTHCQKRGDTSVREHVARMETLIRYTDELPGDVAPLGDSNEAKEIIFQTFHLTHKRDFKRIHGNHLAASLDDIITFMEDAYDGYEQEKALQTKKRHGSQSPHRNNGPNKKQRTSGRDGGTNRSKERCVMHNGTHIFALNCPGNKALSIYDPDHMTKWRNSQSAARRGGRGGGRGGRGRGDFQGRGRGGYHGRGGRGGFPSHSRYYPPNGNNGTYPQAPPQYQQQQQQGTQFMIMPQAPLPQQAPPPPPPPLTDQYYFMHAQPRSNNEQHHLDSITFHSSEDSRRGSSHPWPWKRGHTQTNLRR